MRLSWNEVRTRAAAFADEWRDASYEKGETHSFYNDFFQVFGVRRRNLARYEEHVTKLNDSQGFIDLFWPGVLIVEQKSAGRDLESAYEQAGDYFDAIPEHEKPRYILVSDFQHFALRDLDEQETDSFELKDLPDHVESFGFIMGVQRKTFCDQDPVNIAAAELVGNLHDALNSVGYREENLERFLVRIVFCLFADDTGDLRYTRYIQGLHRDAHERGRLQLGLVAGRTIPGAQYAGEQIAFRRGMKTSHGFHTSMASCLTGRLSIPAFDASMRRLLLEACNFDWSNISPAIFGALFQSVMDPVERRAAGAHYTTEQNILKVIEPLFMDDLRAEFERLKVT